jgi:hypothetical protein
MNARALCIGQFIAATDFGIPGVIDAKEPTFTLGRCARETIADMKKVGKEKEAGIVYFSDYPRGWVMNSTNLQCLRALFGEETDDWTGKRVTLFTMPTNTGPGIRIKGSPDLTAPVDVVVKLPKKAPIRMTLVPTGNRRPAATPYDEFAAAVKAHLSIEPAAVCDWARETSGRDLKTCTAADLRATYDRLKPGGLDRANFDASPFAG